MSNDYQARVARLASEPMRLAGPRSGFFTGTAQSIKDIWHHRELLGLLARREIKARYKDSFLGLFWSLAKPFAMLVVYYVAIGKFLGAEQVRPGQGGIPQFAIFIFTGLTAWQLFSDTVIESTGSIIKNSALIKKVYVPREVFPLSTVGAALFNFAIQLGILIAATAVLGQFPRGGRWLWFLYGFVVLVVLSVALGMILAAINVYLRDVQYLVEISIMIFFWASPIVYSWALVERTIGGTWLAAAYLANPMTQVIMAFQKAFWVAGDAQPLPPDLGIRLAVTLGLSLLLLWVGQRYFARLQSNFAQEL